MEHTHETVANPSIAIPRALLAALDAAAESRDLNRSQAIREAVRTWLRMNGYPLTLEPAEKAS